MRVYEASTRISAEFGGIRDLSRHLSLNFKVTLDAVNDCKVLRLSESNVRRAFEVDPDLEFLVDCLVSKDITRKLYVINDNVYSASKRARSGGVFRGGKGGAAAAGLPRALDMQRTNSYDAINTGCKVGWPRNGAKIRKQRNFSSQT